MKIILSSKTCLKNSTIVQSIRNKERLEYQTTQIILLLLFYYFLFIVTYSYIIFTENSSPFFYS